MPKITGANLDAAIRFLRIGYVCEVDIELHLRCLSDNYIKIEEFQTTLSIWKKQLIDLIGQADFNTISDIINNVDKASMESKFEGGNAIMKVLG